MASAGGFLSRENKELLWTVLYENNAFSGIPKERASGVQELFEDSLTSAIVDDRDLTGSNKKFISGFVQRISGLKYGASAQSRKEDVDGKFATKRQELTSLLNPKPPGDIDFADTGDGPLDKSRIDTMLETAIRQRELDFASSAAPQAAPHKWLSGEDAAVGPTPKPMSKGIRIGDDIAPRPKKVAWADEQGAGEPPAAQAAEHISGTAFLGKLKRKDDADVGVLGKKLDGIRGLLERLVVIGDALLSRGPGADVTGVGASEAGASEAGASEAGASESN